MLNCPIFCSVEQHAVLASYSAPFENWWYNSPNGNVMYTVPITVLTDGDLTTDPLQGPVCYISCLADSTKIPYVKMQLDQNTKVDKVRLLSMDPVHGESWDIPWG